MREREPREIEVEVIPPGGRIPPPPPTGGKTNEDPFIALVARLMDSVFHIPGTKIRFGFDPLIGLLPGVGDTATAVTSLMLMLRSARAGVPRIVLARMALNVLINTAVGAIPGVGDLFSVYFKSNARNYELHRRHVVVGRASTKPDWVFVVSLLSGLAIVLVLIIVGALALIGMLFRTVAGQ